MNEVYFKELEMRTINSTSNSQKRVNQVLLLIYSNLSSGSTELDRQAAAKKKGGQD